MTSEQNDSFSPVPHSSAPGSEEPQLQQRLLHLATQLDNMQSQLDHLLAESQSGTGQIAALTQNLTNPQASQALHERLAELATQLENNSAQLERLTETVGNAPQREQLESLAQSVQGAASRDQLDALAERLERVASHEEVARLTETVTQLPRHQQLDELVERLASGENLSELAGEFKRLSRTQFKANALTESKEQQIAAALSTLQEIATRREGMDEERQAQARERIDTARAHARGDLAADLLPALDGVELALENGRALLEKHAAVPRPDPRTPDPRTPAPQPVQPVRESRGWLGRLFGGEPEPAPAPVPPTRVPRVDTRAEMRADEMRADLSAWLDGLELVRDRFLKLLAAEDVQPIPAEGQPFDPHLHVAVETVQRADVAPNTVVEVVRRGYRQRRRVLRYAEVIVAREE